jgi:hypothetical protein
MVFIPLLVGHVVLNLERPTLVLSNRVQANHPIFPRSSESEKCALIVPIWFYVHGPNAEYLRHNWKDIWNAQTSIVGDIPEEKHTPTNLELSVKIYTDAVLPTAPDPKICMDTEPGTYLEFFSFNLIRCFLKTWMWAVSRGIEVNRFCNFLFELLLLLCLTNCNIKFIKLHFKLTIYTHFSLIEQ